MPVTQQDPVGQHALTVVLLFLILALGSCLKGPAHPTEPPTIVCNAKTGQCTPVVVGRA